jgi:hypothetical protein
MRNTFLAVITCLTFALSGCAMASHQEVPSANQPQPSPSSHIAAENPSYLFAVMAASGSTVSGQPKQGEEERFALTLEHVAPVTQFADRPLRSALLLRPEELVSNWSYWFADSPPNAVLTFGGAVGYAPHSIVVTLTAPRYESKGSKITFTATRIFRAFEASANGKGWKRTATPSNFIDASLFIDNSGDSTTDSLVTALQQSMQPFVFAANDARTWGAVTEAMSGILLSAWQQGSLSGETAAQAFSVTCAPSSEQILNGYLTCSVRMQLSSGVSYSTTLTQTMAY